MNSILHLKGRFDQRPNPNKPGPAILPKGKSVSSSHIHALQQQLSEILVYWTEHREIAGALISVHYQHVIAKSNRIRILLAEANGSPVDSIRGAKFVWDVCEDG